MSSSKQQLAAAVLFYSRRVLTDDSPNNLQPSVPVIFSSTERNTILNRKLTTTILQEPEQDKYCWWTPTVQGKVSGFNSLLQAFQNTQIGMNDMGGGEEWRQARKDYCKVNPHCYMPFVVPFVVYWPALHEQFQYRAKGCFIILGKYICSLTQWFISNGDSNVWNRGQRQHAAGSLRAWS